MASVAIDIEETKAEIQRARDRLRDSDPEVSIRLIINVLEHILENNVEGYDAD